MRYWRNQKKPVIITTNIAYRIVME